MGIRSRIVNGLILTSVVTGYAVWGNQIIAPWLEELVASATRVDISLSGAVALGAALAIGIATLVGRIITHGMDRKVGEDG